VTETKAQRAARHVREFKERNRVSGPPPNTPHGTSHGYDEYMCRCGRCCEAKNKRNRDQYARRQARPIPADAVHGTRTTYNGYRCRCESCRKAESDYRTARRRASGVRPR
jgi:hypothetical protein